MLNSSKLPSLILLDDKIYTNIHILQGKNYSQKDTADFWNRKKFLKIKKCHILMTKNIGKPEPKPKKVFNI